MIIGGVSGTPPLGEIIGKVRGMVQSIIKFSLTVLFATVMLSFQFISAADAKEKDKIGPGLYPALGVTYSLDDNVFKNDEFKEEDNIFLIQPSITLKSLFRKHSFEASYFVDVYRFDANKDEDVEDHFVDGLLTLNLRKWLALELGADYALAHESRGSSGSRLEISLEPDEWNAKRLMGGVILGNRESKNQLEVRLEGYERRYTNNQQETRDRDRKILTATYYRNREKTRLLLEGQYRDYDYFDKRASLDLTSEEYRVLGGIEWDATDKTTGIFKAGWLSKRFDDSTNPDFSGFSVISEVSYEPKSYIEIVLLLSRITKESPHSIANYYVSTTAGLDYIHDLTEALTLTGRVRFQEDDFNVLSTAERKDDYVDFDVDLEYNIWRNFFIAGRYLNSSRDSSFPDINYRSNLFSISLIFDTMKQKVKSNKNR